MITISMDNAPRDSFEEWCQYQDGVMAAVQGLPGIGSETFLSGYRDAYAQIEEQTARSLEHENQ